MQALPLHLWGVYAKIRHSSPCEQESSTITRLNVLEMHPHYQRVSQISAGQSASVKVGTHMTGSCELLGSYHYRESSLKTLLILDRSALRQHIP
jgi:hypothetical protein